MSRQRRSPASSRAVVVVALVLGLLPGLAPGAGTAAPVGAAAGPPGAGPPGPAAERPEAPAWEWPVGGPSRVLRPFDPPAQRWGRGHRGVDLLAPAGGPVRAVADGVVSYSGEIAGVGVVAVRHRGGLRSTYQPVADPVAAGTVVGAGDRLGRLAHGHCLPLSCLHLGAVVGRDTYHDPLLLLRGWRVRLLPLRRPGGATVQVADSWTRRFW